MIETHRKLIIREQRENRFAEKLTEHSMLLRRARPEILQVNVGKLCNLTCAHCHVNAGPKRKEIMTRETIDRIIDWFGNTDIPVIDLTGGAPEMIPDFRYFIEQVKSLQPHRHIIDRSNLTILLERGYEHLAEFLATNKVEIIASMPCYTPENVNAQRGEGVFEGSIAGLQLLNSLGYGIDRSLSLRLITRESSKGISELCLTSFMRSRIFRSVDSQVISGITTNWMNTWSW
jgi:radical SAM/Cys-rich protein